MDDKKRKNMTHQELTAMVDKLEELGIQQYELLSLAEKYRNGGSFYECFIEPAYKLTQENDGKMKNRFMSMIDAIKYAIKQFFK